MFAALVVLALTGATTASAPSPPIEVLEAGRVDYDVSRERGVATGGVVLRRGLVIVRADTVSYDSNTGEVEASGHVLLTEPGRTVAASSLHLVLDGPYEARDVIAFVKDAPLDLSSCKTIEEARARGRNRATMSGPRVWGGSKDPGFEMDRMRVTLCDCGGTSPSWEIRARHARVVPNDHAWLTLPVLYITPRFLFSPLRLFGYRKDPPPVPVLILPVAYLPLADRQSGLLIPDVSFGGNEGTAISEPLFLAFGRSYDATISPSYFFGSEANGRGVKGAGGSLQLRWTPTEGSRGEMNFFMMHSEIATWPDGAALPPRMNRIALTLFHDQRFSDQTRLLVDVALVDDPYYVVDFNSNAVVRANEYRRSAIVLTNRHDNLALEADAAYLQPLTYLDEGCNVGDVSPTGVPCGRAPFGLFGGDVPVFHRLPSASATLLPERLAGPVYFSATAGVARFASAHGAIGGE
ncbi:MAG TPA: LPS-assembly protein LptD, partial [Anaeromyxobacteraceae bacterium]|nr:LPS-assembly protein LptD [Anaeromyxobacteraceae bacterium]